MSTTFAPPADRTRQTVSLLTGDDLHLFNEGTHYDLWKKLVRMLSPTATPSALTSPSGRRMRRSVSVIGDFNGWNKGRTPAAPRGSSGIWEGFVPGLDAGAAYKYHIVSRANGYRRRKGRSVRLSPRTRRRPRFDRLGSRLPLARPAWMAPRDATQSPDRADVDLRGPPRLLGARPAGRQSLARLPRDGADPGRPRHTMGFTHVEFLPRHGAPVLRLVGLSDHRLFRADQPLRHARRISCT